jgi:hypothetical protein
MAETLPIRIEIKALDRSKAALRGVAGGLKSVAAAAVSMRTALIAAAAVTGMGFLVRQSLNATDALAKTAGRIGTTTAELSKLQFAGELAGLSIEQSNMALQRFTRRTAEAARGTGEAQGALRELGLDAVELSRMPLSTAMLEVADAMSNVESGTQQLRIAFKLFDSEGAGMINMLNQGSDALAGMFRQASALGIVMSQSVATSVERTQDALTRLGFLFRGMRDQIVGALAPALELVVNKITLFFVRLMQSKGGIEEWARSVASSFLNGLANIVEGFGEALKGIQGFINGTVELINVVREFFELEKINEVILPVGESALEAAKKLRELAAAVNAVGEGMTIVVNDNSAPNFFQRLGTAMQGALDAVPSLDQAITSLTTGAMSTFSDAFTDAITGAKSFADAVKDMARSVINSLIKMLVQYYITKPLFDAITGFVGGISGGGAGASSSLQTGAVGAPTSAGRPMLVGERGPELFIPSSSGQIVPNGRMGGGGTVHQTINISTGVAQTVRAEVLNLMPQIAESAKAAVADARMRGGGYSKSLLGT